MKFFAVRITLADDYGSTITRNYVRGPMRLGKQAFTSFAVGDFIGLVSEGTWAGYEVIDLHEISADDLISDRKAGLYV